MSGDKKMFLSKVASFRPRGDFEIVEAVVKKEGEELVEERSVWEEFGG